MSQNHLIDPTFFYDIMPLFCFDYDWYHVVERTMDEYQNQKSKFEKLTIYGSLQSQGNTLNQSKSGNTESWAYNFYCKSSSRIEIGDFIVYKHKLLHVESVNDYDEWGVRECSVKMVSLTAYKDLMEYIKYLTGEIVI